MKRIKGRGFFDDVDKFLKKSKIISNVGSVLLPVLGASGAGLLTANPLGATVGAAAGSSANEYIKSLGYGKKMQGKGLTISSNGTFQATAPPTKMKGNGGTQYNAVFSEFGKVKF